MDGRRKTKKSEKLIKIFFLNDEDGFSSRDFLLIATVGMYFMLFTFCLGSLVVNQSIPSDAFKLFASTDSIIITVVGGTMGVVGIEKLMTRPKKTSSDTKAHKEGQKETQPDDGI